MAYQAKCFCGNIHVKIPYDPMMHFRCHCSDCQVLWGGSFSGLAFTEDELEIKGDITTHTYYGGSGLSLHLNFCSHCSTKIYSKPDILNGMVYVPAGLLHDQIDFMPKVEIWAKSKPKWMVGTDSILQAYEENGTIERITSILENLDQRG